jgi:hypothetical protein
MSESSKRYNELKRTNIAKKLSAKINSYSPELTDNDYLRGYVTRYFIQRVNDKSGPIFELSSKEFGKFKNNALYNKTFLRWRLKGPKQPTYDSKNGKMLDMGVFESNRKSIELASSTMPNLKLYLPNLIQFYQSE